MEEHVGNDRLSSRSSGSGVIGRQAEGCVGKAASRKRRRRFPTLHPATAWARRIGFSPHPLCLSLGLLMASSSVVACSSVPVTPASAKECLGSSSTEGVLAFTGEPVAELDDAVAAGFSDQNGRYGFVSARSNAETARAVLIPGGSTKAPVSGYFVATRGDAEPFLASLPAADPWLAYQTTTSVIDAARTGALEGAAEEAAAVEIAVLLPMARMLPARSGHGSTNAAGNSLRQPRRTLPRHLVTLCLRSAAPLAGRIFGSGWNRWNGTFRGSTATARRSP